MFISTFRWNARIFALIKNGSLSSITRSVCVRLLSFPVLLNPVTNAFRAAAPPFYSAQLNCIVLSIVSTALVFAFLFQIHAGYLALNTSASALFSLLFALRKEFFFKCHHVHCVALCCHTKLHSIERIFSFTHTFFLDVHFLLCTFVS